MKKLIFAFGCLAFLGRVYAMDDKGQLENNLIAWQWEVSAGKMSAVLTDKVEGAQLKITSDCFQLLLGDGKTSAGSGFQAIGTPRLVSLAGEPGSAVAARHFPGSQLVWEFSNAPHHLRATWKAILRDGSSYVREELALRATGGDVWLKRIVLFDQPMPEARTVGSVSGSPVVAGTFFCGYEHPMAQNIVEKNQVVRCSLERNAVLRDGETLVQSFVLGVVPAGQTRRGFLAYLERERAHPYRPFLHYNSWFDIAWDKQKFNESQSLNAIEQIGRHLVQERSVRMDSFLFDDGWDDNRSLWNFHAGFPHGFTALKETAAAYHAGIGVWLSPFGGYDEARRQRLQYARQFGYETNASGFSLAGPKYYQLFHHICLEMMLQYGVNQFKFDGLAAGVSANQNGLTRDGDAMLELIADLRATDPNIYINQTTGTWPSPFWLRYVDSTWRGGDDHSFLGQGSWCQQWMTYRDAQTYRNVVQRAPLYPLNALMLHGIIYATNALHLTAMSHEDFANQAREFFGSGTQLQELYITPSLLDSRNWDDLAEAAIWSRQNADVLVDTHWIGGDPAKGEVYGWASWSPRKGIVVLRNPTSQPATFNVGLETLFECSPQLFQLKSPWKDSAGASPVEISRSCTVHLRPFEVLVREASPVFGLIKTSALH